MKTLSVANFKGGVAKTISAANIAHILAAKHDKRVLLIDNDPQGNLSRLFNLYDYDSYSIADVINDKANGDIAIGNTAFERLDIVPANLSLSITENRVRDKVYSEFLATIAERYDYCIIDNAPTAGIHLTRALIASDEVIIPVTIDQFAIDGLSELTEQIALVEEYANHNIKIAGAFITNFQKTKAQISGAEWLRANADIRIFDTQIRRSAKVTESTIHKLPLLAFSPRSAPAQDYDALVTEYLNGGGGNG
jgi:chromosome partitioning protein